ncbi:MAG: DUF4013 domain-containing protein, partial [Anaerolineales bacterium]|nr:DUF4013 domain-containing protein [Anaerolineales bacterium]
SKEAVMEFGKAFTFPFDDQEWLTKLGIAALVMLIPIVGQFIVIGWALEVTRRVIQREPQLLPDWSDFVGHLVRGLKALVIGLVYALPIILVSACQQGSLIAVQESGDETVMSVVTVLTICLSCITLIYSIFMGLVLPAAMAKFAATGQLGAAFRFGEVFGLVRAAPAAYVIVLVGSFVASIIAMLGMVVCVIGVLFTAAYASVINAHLYGQAYNEAVAASAVALETAY